MCGIYAVLGNNAISVTDTGFHALAARGPDSHVLKKYGSVIMGFHRLRVNDLSDSGDQPMSHSDGLHLICNGEIYNHKEIQTQNQLVVSSQSDCAVILPLYARMHEHSSSDLHAFINTLDGEFAFVVYDEVKSVLIAVRDPYGVRPLFYGRTSDGGWAWASELKGIHDICTDVTPFKPGHVMTVDTRTLKLVSYETYDADLYPSYDPDVVNQYDEEKACTTIRQLVTDAVKKRVLVSDRPVCSLLSGGLDSSLVAALAASVCPPGKLHTFSIGMPGSTDLKYAAQVAQHIGSTHTTITLSEDDFLDAIPETIRIIESYDTTSVRASVGNYLVSAYIARHSDNKVVLNGDYSDEVCGGYKYMGLAPDYTTFAAECERLVRDIYLFDSLRSDRTICSQGLEARTPFSDKAFVKYYLSLPAEMRIATAVRMEKYLLRKAFDCTGLLPESVLWRRKEAFSDGVSSPENSWHKILQAHIEKQVSDADFENRATRFPFNTPQLKETYYYRTLFERYYPGRESVIPYYWLPRFCGDLKDPSAREIKSD